ncbi:MAG: CBS domain-containing protein [Anaerolineales bacterium]|nr:CBS domain-containing protein [Anaerolineales bacterium]
MFVKDRMTPDPICGHPDMAVTEAQDLMLSKGFRHLPIVIDSNKLVGLITRTSLRSALPSDISRFSRFEVSYTLSKIKVRSVMVKNVITIEPDIPIENAACLMADKLIGTLPVVQDDRLVGIISDSDLFTTMTSLLGARIPGIRVTVQQPDQSGVIARLTSVIADAGGFLSVCVGYSPEGTPRQWVSLYKVQNIEEDRLVELITSIEDTTILDIRQFQEP